MREIKNNNNILFVDDDEKVINAFKKQLQNKFNVDFVMNPIDALELIKKNSQYSVVISDMKMPGLDGLKFLEKVKKISSLTTRIMITGYADLDLAINAINKGNIFRFLTKPCPKEDLLKTIEEAIKNYNEAIKQKIESLTDPLTGLWNRRYLNKEMSRVLNSAERYNYNFSLVFIDINCLKKINDTLGHDSGDLAIKTIAKLLNDTCRNTDIISRYGGDEFIILLEHTDRKGTENLVNRLKNKISEEHTNKNLSMDVGISTGIATFPDDAKDIKTLLKIADKEMYKDKNPNTNLSSH